ncbi:MAG: hypothetical protein AB7E55_10560, partial [Pigmentiphaga sp.]
VVVADTAAEALAVARPAYRRWYDHMMHLWVVHGTRPQNLAFPEEFDDAQRLGLGIAGSPETVRDWIAASAAEAGVNYFVCRLAFGDLSLKDSLRSTRLMADHVLPALSGPART